MSDRGEFEKGYCERSGITVDEYRNYYVTLPCGCPEDECPGWASVRATPQAINTHMDLYAPQDWQAARQAPASGEVVAWECSGEPGLKTDVITSKAAANHYKKLGRNVRPLVYGDTKPPAPSPEALAKQFHEAYERLASGYGYETREETRVFDPDTPNGKLMIAVMSEINTHPPAKVPEGWSVRRSGDRITVQHPVFGGYCASKDPVNDGSQIAPVILYHLAETLLTATTVGAEWRQVIEENCWDVRCTSEPTGGDDYDVLWHVIEHHMAEPHERTLATDTDLERALNRALTSPQEQ